MITRRRSSKHVQMRATTCTFRLEDVITFESKRQTSLSPRNDESLLGGCKHGSKCQVVFTAQWCIFQSRTPVNVSIISTAILDLLMQGLRNLGSTWIRKNFCLILRCYTTAPKSLGGSVYVVVNFLSQVIFVFLLFLGMVMYANEV